jgi:hypothetical protein
MIFSEITIRDLVVKAARLILFPALLIYYACHIPRRLWSVKSCILFLKLSTYFVVKLRRLPNVMRPRDLNDYIQRSKLFSQTTEQILLSDKLLSKDWVESFEIPGLMVPKTLAVLSNYEQYRELFLDIPHVLKVNHDSGGVELVPEKPFTIDKERFHKLENRLQHKFGDISGEWPYKYIEPKMFVEEFIDFDGQQPEDYKFYCVNGKVKFCHFIYGRDRGIPFEKLVDKHGADLGICLHPKFDYGCNNFITPVNWQRMIRICETLSAAFPMVRVDLYSVNGNVFFGEMTFFPQSGTYIGDGQKQIYALMDVKLQNELETIYM